MIKDVFEHTLGFDKFRNQNLKLVDPMCENINKQRKHAYQSEQGLNLYRRKYTILFFCIIKENHIEEHYGDEHERNSSRNLILF
jgi:hypothetical protein